MFSHPKPLYVADSVKELAEQSATNVPKIDHRIPLLRWFRSADTVFREAKSYKDDGDLEMSYVLFLRYADIGIQVIPKHKDYKTYTGPEKNALKKLVGQTIQELESLKKTLNSMYEAREAEAKKKELLLQQQQQELQIQIQKQRELEEQTKLNERMKYENNYDISNLQKQQQMFEQMQKKELKKLGHNELSLDDSIPKESLTYNLPEYDYKSSNYTPTVQKSTPINIDSNISSQPVQEQITQIEDNILPPLSESVPLQYQPPSSLEPEVLPEVQPPSYDPPRPSYESIQTPPTHSNAQPPMQTPPQPIQYQSQQPQIKTQVQPQYQSVSQPKPPSMPLMHPMVPPMMNQNPMMNPMMVPYQMPYMQIPQQFYYNNVPVKVVPSAPPRINQPSNPVQPTAPNAVSTSNNLSNSAKLINGLRELVMDGEIVDAFMEVSKSNTSRDIETCGILAGVLKNGRLHITSVIIPKQTGSSDTCAMTNEEEVFEYQDTNNLLTLGWIHTHPSHDCFLSSVDMHTQGSYQFLLKEAVAVVVAPKVTPNVGIFTLTDPLGLQSIQACELRGFHPHEKGLYKVCDHVKLNWKSPTFKLVDLRKK